MLETHLLLDTVQILDTRATFTISNPLQCFSQLRQNA